MSLVSMEFLLFAAAAVAGYYWIPKRCQWMWLLLFSYIYYASGGIRVTCFLLFTTLTSYAAGILVEQAAEKIPDKKKAKRRGKQVLAAALLLNFGILGVLKYTNFALHTVNGLFGTEFGSLQFLLPLGISFYTFQSMGYLLDVYWGRAKAEHHLFRFALFVSFFPQILQGPIGRFSALGEQLYASHPFDGKRIERGCLRILWGYFKKMAIADNAVIFVDAIFGNPELYDGLGLMGVLMYSIQLYCDFSGGMDVVIGIGELFGIHLDENFKRPYFAVSITDFWHRWHITLGTWMKDYVFYPVTLSGWMKHFSKFAKKAFGKQTGRTLPICLANLIVFFVVGVWHGAAWTYVAWGAMQGLLVVLDSLGIVGIRGREEKRPSRFHIPAPLGWIVTFTLFNLSLFFFRSSSMLAAGQLFKNLLSLQWNGKLFEIAAQLDISEIYVLRQALELTAATAVNYLYLFVMLLLFVLAFYLIFHKNAYERATYNELTSGRCWAVSILFIWCVISLSQVSTFLYFNF